MSRGKSEDQRVTIGVGEKKRETELKLRSRWEAVRLRMSELVPWTGGGIA